MKLTNEGITKHNLMGYFVYFIALFTDKITQIIQSLCKIKKLQIEQLSYLKTVANDLKTAKLIQITTRQKCLSDAGYIATLDDNTNHYAR